MSWQARLSKSLSELRIVYCAHSQSSAGTREFVQKYYADLKKLNPNFPIYIRPCDGVQPTIAARYNRGLYSVQKTQNMNVDRVVEVVRKLEGNAEHINAKFPKAGFGIGMWSRPQQKQA